MSKFHNPYHFVPVVVPSAEYVPLSELYPTKRGDASSKRTTPNVAHDRFVPRTHSGRLVCRVTVETPLICGSQQEDREGWTKLIKPFELRENEPALPASGLRGVLSALIESASGSSLRVLQDTSLSHRMGVATESLSAIGLLVNEVDAEGNPIIRLQPLIVPTVDKEYGDVIPEEYSEMFQARYGQPLLKAYVNGYRKVGASGVGVLDSSFIQKHSPKSQSADHQEFWYARLSGSVSLSSRSVVATAEVRDSRKHRFLLAQKIVGDPITQGEFDALSTTEKMSHVRGFLRVLGIKDRENEIPTTKKHEYFIPYPDGSENKIPTFDVADAIRNFHRLADQRTEIDPALPFEVAGSTRNAKPDSIRRQLRLRAGDLVYFRPNRSNPTQVAEVSVSSIWRAGNGCVHEYFADISPNLLPLSPSREQLTLAEQLLGVVETQDLKQQRRLSQRTAIALASRLRVSHAEFHLAPEGNPYLGADKLLSPQQRQAVARGAKDIPLQNLASPKLPCPAMYFKPKTGGHAYVPKNKLNPNGHVPQGRKFYLRRDPASYSASNQAFIHPDRLANPEERASIARQHQSVENFVRPGTTFFFHLDFDNLSDLELQLLTYVLQPASVFRHQLGHGKPLGLGQVKIEIAGLLEIDRYKRYLGNLGEPRWHSAWAEGNPQTDWPLKYHKHLPNECSPLKPKLDELKSGFESWAATNQLSPVLRAIELIGRPLPSAARIHYPQAAKVNRGKRDNPNRVRIDLDTAEFEREHYHWFVQNDDASNQQRPGQFLAPLINSSGQVAPSVPALYREESEKPPDVWPPQRIQTISRGDINGTKRSPSQSALSAGQHVKAKVAKHETVKHKIRVRFEGLFGSEKFIGYLQRPDPNNDRKKYPENGDKEYEFILENPQRKDGVWHVQLKPVSTET